MRFLLLSLVLFLSTAAFSQSSTEPQYDTYKAAIKDCEKATVLHTTPDKRKYAVYVTNEGYEVFYVVATAAGCFIRVVLLSEPTAAK